jgi:hypothetical protein
MGFNVQLKYEIEMKVIAEKSQPLIKKTKNTKDIDPKLHSA